MPPAHNAPAHWHIAEINIARLLAPLSDPTLADFVSQLDEVNRIADESDGFVWRLKGDDGSASTYVRFGDDERVIVNMSVWTSIESLREYVYRSHHLNVFRERARWFERVTVPQLALWWVPAGHVPSIEEGRARLALVSECGPTAESFTFKNTFPPPGC